MDGFVECGFVLCRKVVDGEGGDDEVEGVALPVVPCVVSEDVADVAVFGEALAGHAKHLVGEVDEGQAGLRVAGKQEGGEEPGAASDVECAYGGVGRVGQGVECESVVVVEAGDELAALPVIVFRDGVELCLDVHCRAV